MTGLLIFIIFSFALCFAVNSKNNRERENNKLNLDDILDDMKRDYPLYVEKKKK